MHATPVLGLALAAVLAGPVRADDYDCVIDPSVTVDVAGSSGGIVAEVFVEAGDSVKAGQPLARLESSVEQASVALLELKANDTSAIDAERSRLAFLQGQLDRKTALSERGVIAREGLEEMRTSVEASRSLLAQAELARRVAAQELLRARAALSLLEIRSPIDGVVVERYLEPGEYLPQEGRIATVVRLDPLSVVAYLPTQDYGQIREGDSATVRPAPPVDASLTAQVSRVDRVFDLASGTFAVHLDLPNPDNTIPAGQRCRLSLSGTAASP